VVLALLSAACSPAPTNPPPSQTGAMTPSPATRPAATPSAPATPSPSSSASPVAVEPKVVCETPQKLPGSTLTCDAGVAAARAFVGPDPTVATIEFWLGWGPLCRPGRTCALLLSNTGHVFFRRTSGMLDLVVAVTADKTGKVTASAPMPLPSPSPS
jgi:hypothetical protein